MVDRCQSSLGYVLTKDIPLMNSHCVHDQIVGLWEFSMTDQNKGKEVINECLPDTAITVTKKVQYELKYPNIAVNKVTNATGTWTMVVDTGIEVRIDGLRMINFFKYKKSFWGHITSYCNETFTTWFHEDVSMNPQKWGCQFANRISASQNEERGDIFVYKQEAKKPSKYPTNRKLEAFRRKDQEDHMEFYKQFQTPQKTNNDVLPESFDWRKTNGTNYVSYVEDQAQCGSCYIFSVIGMLDSRGRIESADAYQPEYSEEMVVDCGAPTNQGCDGGLPFLVSKWLGENGLETSKCYPYSSGNSAVADDDDDNSSNNKCKMEKCTVTDYVKDYAYVGGYYGASNEQNMMDEIFHNGPIAVAFAVEEDFQTYTSGVLICGKHKPFDADHAVLIVGWGKEGTRGDKYWIVKNSWGEDWGNDGYFWMRKGQNDCNIEASPSTSSLYYKQ